MTAVGAAVSGDGKRRAIHPADVRGRFTRRRNALTVLLIAVYVALPWIPIGGHPAVFLDVPERRFYLFGLSFNAQDAWLTFFLLAGIGLTLLLVTAVLGRVWCGYACPQTVFLEGVFRRVERWIDGPAQARKRLDAAPLSGRKLARRVAKHLAFAALAAAVAHVFLAYFVSLPGLFSMVRGSPSQHPEAFAWAAAVTALIYFDMAWFREQLCVVVCPYGRLQSVLTDRETLVVGYDKLRGEPRGKVGAEGAGDCVDCRRCVAVCPTGIDIRNGLQLDCVGCAACIDACDDIMLKVGRAPGLVRYDSLDRLERKDGRRRLLRGRVLLYGGGIAAVALGALLSLRGHAPVETDLLRLPGVPYALEGDRVQNSFQLHLVNKTDRTVRFAIAPRAADGVEYVLAEREVALAPFEGRNVPVFVTTARAGFRRGREAVLDVSADGLAPRVVSAPLLGP